MAQRAKKKLNTYHATMVVTRTEEWCVDAESEEEALALLEAGEGQQKDLDLLFGVSSNIVGKTLCAFGDAAATPVLSTMKLFRQEYEAHVLEGRCTLPAEWRAKQPIFAGAH